MTPLIVCIVSLPRVRLVLHSSTSTIRVNQKISTAHLHLLYQSFQTSREVDNSNFLALFPLTYIYIYESILTSRVRYARDLWLGLGEARRGVAWRGVAWYGKERTGHSGSLVVALKRGSILLVAVSRIYAVVLLGYIEQCEFGLLCFDASSRSVYSLNWKELMIFFWLCNHFHAFMLGSL
jgi:hypothetical protein